MGFTGGASDALGSLGVGLVLVKGKEIDRAELAAVD